MKKLSNAFRSTIWLLSIIAMFFAVAGMLAAIIIFVGNRFGDTAAIVLVGVSIFFTILSLFYFHDEEL